jgi:Immunoglobulin domain
MTPLESLEVEVYADQLEYVENLDPIIIDCLVSGQATKVFWKFNDQQLDDKFVMANNTLILGPANRNNSGIYYCTAQSSKKSITDDVEIVVHYPPTLKGANKSKFLVPFRKL